MAGPALAEGHNLGTRKNMNTRLRAGQGKGASGCELWGVLTCEAGEERQQDRSPGHVADVPSSAS